MKKLTTTYRLNKDVLLTVSNETENYMSVHHYQGETCSGILRHWGSKQDLIAELKEVIRVLELFRH